MCLGWKWRNDSRLRWTSAFTNGLRGVLLEGEGQRSALSGFKYSWFSRASTKPIFLCVFFPNSSNWGAKLTRDAALASPALLNPSSPCQNLSQLLQEVIKNDARLFANHGSNLCQKCSLVLLKKNNQLQTI